MLAFAFPLSLLAFLGSPYRCLHNRTARTGRFASAADGVEVVSLTAESLKTDLLQLATDTKRGFEANDAQRQQARSLIAQLQQLNDAKEDSSSSIPSRLEGAWTLVYTDAPDILNLRPPSSSFLPAVVQLGRIGQNCQAPTISNVIEWVRPSWAANVLPFTQPRILQRVVTEGAPNPSKPGYVTLQLSGLQVDTVDDGKSQGRPFLDINGPLTVPFGEFQVLYLDDELRITQTSQGYIAVNIRTQPTERWF